MSLWYSLGLHTVITDKPQVPSEGGLGHVGFNTYSKSYLVILATFFHQSHHPLLLFYYTTFRFPVFYLAQMSDKAWAGEEFKINPYYSSSQMNRSIENKHDIIGLWCSMHPICSCRFLEMKHIQYEHHDNIYGMRDSAKPWDHHHPHSQVPNYAVLWSCQMVPRETQFSLCICGPITSQGCSNKETILIYECSLHFYCVSRLHIMTHNIQTQHQTEALQLLSSSEQRVGDQQPVTTLKQS